MHQNRNCSRARAEKEARSDGKPSTHLACLNPVRMSRVDSPRSDAPGVSGTVESQYRAGQAAQTRV